MSLLAGVARTDITLVVPELSLMGWGITTNTARGVGLPLYARTFAFAEEAGASEPVVLICTDLQSISFTLRQEALDEARRRLPDVVLDDERVLLTANHSHSAPSGYHGHLYYNLRTPGYCPELYDHLVDRLAASVVDAVRALQPARWWMATGRYDDDAPVAFQRSPEAYRRNPDVTQPVTWANRHLGVDRDKTVLFVETPDGAPIGCIDWFGAHCTSIHADNHHIHGDNKGAAAMWTERHFAEAGHDGVVAAYAQGAAGDVSPNFRMDRRRGFLVGAYDDDFVSASEHGRTQAELTMQLWDQRDRHEPMPPQLDAALRYLDFDGAEADPRYTRGERGCRTSTAMVGVPFLQGTKEGPGPLLPLGPAVKGLSKLVAVARGLRARGDGEGAAMARAQGPKVPFLEIGQPRGGRAFGFFTSGDPAIPGWVDPVVQAVIEYEDAGVLTDRAWLSDVHPVQVVRLGALALVALPCEPTTVVGRRLRASASEALENSGVEHVVVSGYTNDYNGYCTTAEEYAVQAYEGGSTYFGAWTCAVYQTEVDRVCARLGTPRRERSAERGALPETVPLTERLGQRWVPPYETGAS